MHRFSRPGPVRAVIRAALILACLAATAVADDSLPDAHDDPGRDWDAILGIDPSSFVSTRSLLTLGLSGVAVAWSWDETDESIGATQDQLDRSSLDPLLDLGNVYGNGWVVGGSSVALLTVGQLADNEKLNAFGGDLMRSFLYSGAATWVLKYSVNRTRPSGGPYSFPSGHTASAFSTAPVVWHHLGWPYGVGASALSVLAGLGRMEEGKHYLSDVIAGAAIGLVIGWAVIDHRHQSSVLSHLLATPNSLALHYQF